MSKYSIDSTTLTSIGDAIRTKESSSAVIPVSDFATRIINLPSGGGGSSEIVQPYNVYFNYYSGTMKLLNSSYRTMDFVVIPYDTWSKYSTITFKYVINCINRPTYDVYGCQMDVALSFVRYIEANAWSTLYVGIQENSSYDFAHIVKDYSGSTSSTYTINCANLTAPSQDYNYLGIILRARPVPSTNYTSHALSVRLGEFTGVEK